MRQSASRRATRSNCNKAAAPPRFLRDNIAPPRPLSILQMTGGLWGKCWPGDKTPRKTRCMSCGKRAAEQFGKSMTAGFSVSCLGVCAV